MPELPEVETTRRGIEPHVLDRTVTAVHVREYRLRWPVPAELPVRLTGRKIDAVGRRGKYLLFSLGSSSMLVHLGMSGSLRLVPASTAAAKHDHIDISLDNGQLLRYTDPRRFGSLLWTEFPPSQHKLLAGLGPEPLSAEFDGDFLYRCAQSRTVAVKNFIMDSRVVVGVGNIYANEALFSAGIHPKRQANRISLPRYEVLATAITKILSDAILSGGTTLRDFVGGDGKPGYFQQELNVYGRAGKNCIHCGTPLKAVRLGQRSSVYCSQCQH